MRQLSDKQIEILALVVKGNTDGSFIDLDQLIERLSYKPTKDALAFSIRHMSSRGLIEKKDTEKRRGASRRIIAATMDGYTTNKEIKSAT